MSEEHTDPLPHSSPTSDPKEKSPEIETEKGLKRKRSKEDLLGESPIKKIHTVEDNKKSPSYGEAENHEKEDGSDKESDSDKEEEKKNEGEKGQESDEEDEPKEPENQNLDDEEEEEDKNNEEVDPEDIPTVNEKVLYHFISLNVGNFKLFDRKPRKRSHLISLKSRSPLERKSRRSIRRCLT